MLGRIFGRLTVVYKSERRGGSGQIYWGCLCECGTQKEILGTSLRYGSTNSCGCLKVERVREAVTTHGMSGTPEYSSWDSMIQRCTNPNNKQYVDYGGAGISVDKRWLDFQNFYKDMGQRPEGTSLNRIGCADIYSKETCEWATHSMQAFDKKQRGKYKTGLQLIEEAGHWVAKISVEGSQKYLGYFYEYEDAVAAREEAEMKYFGRVIR